MVIDHGLRAESLAEAKTAVQQAEKLGFQTVLLKVAWQAIQDSCSYCVQPQDACHV